VLSRKAELGDWKWSIRRLEKVGGEKCIRIKGGGKGEEGKKSLQKGVRENHVRVRRALWNSLVGQMPTGGPV